jgi:hypothetical protein
MTDVIKGRHDYQAVIVWKFDRFARSVQHLLKTLEAFNSNGAFVSLTEAVDTSTPMGKFMLTMLGAVAETELSLIRERIKNGLRKRGAGKPGPKIGPNGPSRTTLWRRAQAQATGAWPTVAYGKVVPKLARVEFRAIGYGRESARSTEKESPCSRTTSAGCAFTGLPSSSD